MILLMFQSSRQNESYLFIFKGDYTSLARDFAKLFCMQKVQEYQQLQSISIRYHTGSTEENQCLRVNRTC